MTDAKKREKVIKWLAEEAVEHEEEEVRDLAHTALLMLEEQEPRVLEYSEIEGCPLVWLEDNDKEDVIPALFLQYNGWNAEFAVQAPDEDVDTIIRSPIVSAVEGMYGITWRAWTSRPSPEQMRETPWEDSDEKPV